MANGSLLNFDKRYEDDLRVIFDQRPKLHLGLDALSNQKILKGIQCLPSASSSSSESLEESAIDLVSLSSGSGSGSSPSLEEDLSSSIKIQGYLMIIRLDMSLN